VDAVFTPSTGHWFKAGWKLYSQGLTQAGRQASDGHGGDPRRRGKREGRFHGRDRSFREGLLNGVNKLSQHDRKAPRRLHIQKGSSFKNVDVDSRQPKSNCRLRTADCRLIFGVLSELSHRCFIGTGSVRNLRGIQEGSQPVGSCSATSRIRPRSGGIAIDKFDNPFRTIP